jgi:hypothetical protein
MKNKLGIILFLMLFAALFAGAFFFGKKIGGGGISGGSGNTSGSSDDPESSMSYVEIDTTTQEEKELKLLTEKLVKEMRAEERLDLSMVSQLRSYREMLAKTDRYAKRVEKELDVIKEINEESFQEDILLQAALFSGKKPTLVAKHLEGFNPSRIGAILSKMKKKEASAVLDVWASVDDPDSKMFYRSVMSSYLTNKRRDMDPELYQKASPNQQMAQN